MVSFLDIVFCGDLVLDEPRPEYWLSGIAPALHDADLAVGHLEVPHTRRGTEMKGDVPAPGADPDHLAALVEAGFDALTLSGNHMADCGPEGIADTKLELERLGIVCCGAGADLREARCPAELSILGKRISVLSYNCVGPEKGWATDTDAGVAFVRIETANGGPIIPSARLEQAMPESVRTMQQDITSAKQNAELLMVALHKGIVHTPARLAPYEQPVAHAAIDAGADIVLGHHAHIIRGIEFYRGKPIFHGLGNGCVVTRALSPDQDHPARTDWARKRKELFGFDPDPEYRLAPFHPQAVNSILGRVRWHDDGQMEAGFIPVHVEPPGRPVIADGAKAREIIDYVAQITVAADLPSLLLRVQDYMVVAS
ncbi:MAG: CapA family protein [Deltaproteobacteria bacterium]|nr:CapA family protein [Deltaproteobacteria bacterium]